MGRSLSPTATSAAASSHLKRWEFMFVVNIGKLAVKQHVCASDLLTLGMLLSLRHHRDINVRSSNLSSNLTQSVS